MVVNWSDFLYFDFFRIVSFFADNFGANPFCCDPLHCTCHWLQVMVELGTGFYAEKNLDDAIAFVDRKIALIETNSSNVLKIIQATQSNVESINVSMQGKLLEIRAKQEGLKHQAANA